MCEYCVGVEDERQEYVLSCQEQGLVTIHSFDVYVDDGKIKLLVSTGSDCKTVGEAKIHYCPMCGRKLEE